ncbi:MAG: tRNA (adenosine(37)-N6)-dimethylallyltransferase MiaA [Flavisolibacter sp.]
MAAKKLVIVIAGPTAVGKTSVAIALAKHLHTEIISADSRQCFKELNIGVARPSPGELSQVKHHFIASHSIHQKITAATFEQYALEKSEEIFKEKDVLVVTGGTGLYIKAFCEGMDDIPDVAPIIRQQILSEYEQHGLEWLQAEVHKLDSAFYDVGEIKNPHRLIRALEVFKSTGKSILSFRKGNKALRPFDIVKIALELPKEELHRNIENRIEKMMQNGLEEEVRSLVPYQHLNALQTVGYRELFDYLNGQTDLQQAVHLLKRNTKQYAKRQMTWFKKDLAYHWMHPDPVEVIRNFDSLTQTWAESM